MKKLLSLLITLSLLVLSVPVVTAVSISDVTVENQNYTAIKFLYNQGVISGYPDGTFKPEGTVNRAELSKILVGGVGANPSETVYKDCFPDVADQWFAKYVCYAKERGWVDGYPDGTFKPEQTVNKVEAVKMVVNSQEFELADIGDVLIYFDVANSAWYADYVMTAQVKGFLIEPVDDVKIDTLYGVADDMTRGEMSEMIYRAMIIKEKELDSFYDYLISGPYKVTYVVDGDTADVMIDGEEVRLRFIGVDTPETVHPDKPVQCYGKEASAKTHATLLNQYVMLEADVTQSDKDSYGRLLRYVILEDGTNFNETLISNGYGFEYTYDSNPYQYQTEFMAAEQYAQDNILGLWDPNTCDGVASEVDATTNTDTNTNTSTDTGNYKFYVSSQARTKYYCETDSSWENLSKDNLLEFGSEAELIEWMTWAGKDLVLNQPC